MNDVDAFKINVGSSALLMGALVYLQFNDIGWLHNLTYFYMWLGVAIMTFLSFFVGNDVVKKAMKEKAPSKTHFLFIVWTDVAFVLFLAALGDFVLAGLWAFSSIMVNSTRKEFVYAEA